MVILPAEPLSTAAVRVSTTAVGVGTSSSGTVSLNTSSTTATVPAPLGGGLENIHYFIQNTIGKIMKAAISQKQEIIVSNA